MKKIIVGYQGISGSNTQEAAKQILLKMGINHTVYELVPLICSKKVIASLKNKEIDYGVIAMQNNVGGVVQESFEAIKNENLHLVSTEALLIKHSAFKKRKEIRNEDIRLVISHEQALKQCKNNIARLFPNAQTEAVEDTATAAKYLSEGIYDEHTVAICKIEAGIMYNLYLEKEEIQDRPDNETRFAMFRLPTEEEKKE